MRSISATLSGCVNPVLRSSISSDLIDVSTHLKDYCVSPDLVKLPNIIYFLLSCKISNFKSQYFETMDVVGLNSPVEKNINNLQWLPLKYQSLQAADMKVSLSDQSSF